MGPTADTHRVPMRSMKPCDSERRPLPLQRENEMFPGDTVLSGAPDPGAARALLQQGLRMYELGAHDL